MGLVILVPVSHVQKQVRAGARLLALFGSVADLLEIHLAHAVNDTGKYNQKELVHASLEILA